MILSNSITTVNPTHHTHRTHRTPHTPHNAHRTHRTQTLASATQQTATPPHSIAGSKQHPARRHVRDGSDGGGAGHGATCAAATNSGDALALTDAQSPAGDTVRPFLPGARGKQQQHPTNAGAHPPRPGQHRWRRRRSRGNGTATATPFPKHAHSKRRGRAHTRPAQQLRHRGSCLRSFVCLPGRHDPRRCPADVSRRCRGGVCRTAMRHVFRARLLPSARNPRGSFFAGYRGGWLAQPVDASCRSVCGRTLGHALIAPRGARLVVCVSWPKQRLLGASQGRYIVRRAEAHAGTPTPMDPFFAHPPLHCLPLGVPFPRSVSFWGGASCLVPATALARAPTRMPTPSPRHPRACPRPRPCTHAHAHPHTRTPAHPHTRCLH